MEENVIYPGRDLEAMAFADKYHRWILENFKPYMGKRLVEVGAGSGSFSELLMELHSESLSLVEPSKEMYGRLEGRINGMRARANVSTYNSIFSNVAETIKAEHAPDSIIYVNVLEHIEDDEAELGMIHGALTDGGRAFIFVPALRWLYGKFDESIGHFRRYTKPELEEKCRRAGFRIILSKYFDVMGIVPWWLKYRLLRSSTMEPRAVGLYDKYIVPVTKTAEKFANPPLGKNILLIAEKVPPRQMGERASGDFNQ
jgi:SAM-dependent methyltransferase